MALNKGLIILCFGWNDFFFALFLVLGGAKWGDVVKWYV